jgi:hypothetical protein
MLTRAQVGAQVGTQVWDQVWAQVGDQVRAQVWDQVWDQVRAQVGAQVWDQVRAQVRAQVGTQVRAQVWAQVRLAGYGQHDSGWLAFYDVFTGHVEGVNRLRGLKAVARDLGGWWWPFQRACIYTPRPVAVHRDAQYRLHAPGEMALSYPDGWGIYAWHGVPVPEHVIRAPLTLTAEQITTEPNAEIRRVMLERFGYERYLHATGATKVQADDYGEVYRFSRRDDSDVVMVKVVNATPDPDGTFHDYWLRVPPTIQSAREGVAWSFTQEPDTYAPAIQT